MLLSNEETSRLHEIFRRLWGNRNGVNGSWGASSYGYHPTYIRRGALLLRGTTKFDDLYVLSPGNYKVILEYGDPRCYCDTMPKVDGTTIRIYDNNDGIWWDALREEIPKLEQELQESANARLLAQQQEAQRKSDERAKELALAMQALSND